MSENTSNKNSNISNCKRIKIDQLEENNPDPSNGLILNDIFLPSEVIVHILSYVNTEHLQKNCVLVCQQWHELIKNFVWKEKAERILNKRLIVFPWELYYNICWKNNFDVNLIKNPYGEHNLSDWKILRNGGNKWIVENPPQGIGPLPDEFGNVNSCFVTSDTSCSKVQIIDLLKVGFLPKVLDEFQPHIYVSEWCGVRSNCGCVYEQTVLLLDEHKNSIKQFKYQYTEDGYKEGYWHKITHTFKNYGPNVRYILFYHGGQDKQILTGHFGSKMTGTTVKLLLDSILKPEKNTELLNYKCIYVSKNGKGDPTIVKQRDCDNSEMESVEDYIVYTDGSDYEETDDSNNEGV